MMTHRWTLCKLAVLISDRAECEWGFTLVEIMISLVILSVGLLGLASQTLSVIKANSLSDQMTRATVLAEDKMEELKRLGYAHAQLQDTDSNTADVSTDIQTNPSFFTNPDHSNTNPTSETGTVTLTSTPKRVWNVANNTPATGMKTVTVIVGWKTATQTGAAAKSHYVALTTIIHEYQ
jgi:prepilin-type N-terminal cleavage/methylation domain-containing protein